MDASGAGGQGTVDTTSDDALGSSDATVLIARLARREVSPRELRDAALERARRVNPHLNALTQWLEEPVGTDLGVDPEAPLAGIPTALKDNEPLAGYPTSNGSAAVPDVAAPASSPFVRHFLALGLDPIGTTTLPEFGLTASTESTRFGATRNPWDPGRSVGGSSGGSAALVASGVVPIAHSNDGGGSSRIPASVCGLVGLKPTRGRLPDALGVDLLPVQITAQGVLTRTVRDTALYYAHAERAFRADGLPPIGHVTAPSGRRLRIGVFPGAASGLPVTPDTVAAVRATGELCTSLGHHVEDVGPPVGDQFGPDFLVLWAYLAFLLHRGGRFMYGPGFDRRRTEIFTWGLSARLLRQVDRVPGALRRLRRLAREHEAAFDSYDVLLTPVTGHSAPPIGHLGPDVEFRIHLVRLMRFCSMTPVQNVSGSPAISLPLGRGTDGLPIGVHLAAPFGQERRLLELALELEAAAPWPTTPGSARTPA